VVAWDSSRVEARGRCRVEAHDTSRVVVWGSTGVVAHDSSHVEAHESTIVDARDCSHVEARESSRVEARGSSRVQVRGSSGVLARGSSRVLAWESARVVARESSCVVAGQGVAVHLHHGPRDRASVRGGVVIDVHVPTTAKQWCDYHGVAVRDGLATLFKAVDNDFRSERGVAYVPGTTPAALDWDEGASECGGGLHFSPQATMALSFFPEATRFVACEVQLAEIVIHPDGAYPEKVKAPRVAGAVYEVDGFGDPVDVGSPAGRLTYSS
jgi:hypothetical protein